MKTILFVAALQEELDALWDKTALQDKTTFEWSEPQHKGDAIWYREAKWGDFRIIAATASEMGLVASGIVTTKLILQWMPEIVIDLGLCAGRSDKVEMSTGSRTQKRPFLRGDIIVSEACFLYAAGFHHNEKLKQIEAKCTAEKKALRFAKKANGKWEMTWKDASKPKECAHEPTPKVFNGEYAAADYLMRNANVMDEIAKKHENFCALEMESYAVAKSAKILGVPFGALIVKAILDNGTPQKDDAKRFLALTASRVYAVKLAKEFMDATRMEKSGWHKHSLPMLAFPQKECLLLSSSKTTFEKLEKELNTSQLPRIPKSLVKIHSYANKPFILAETSIKRPCGQADFAIWSTYFISKCKPRLVLAVGLCRGIPKREKLELGKPGKIKSCTGDLIFANRAYHHQFGAMTEGKELEREIRSVDLNDKLRGFLHSIHAESLSKWLNNFPSVFVKIHPKASKPDNALKCHIEPAASSDYLLKDDHLHEHISEFDRKVKGVDIEGYAIMRAAQHCGVNLGALLVRGVSSHLNPSEGKRYKIFSCALSVHIVVEMLGSRELEKLLSSS